MHLDLLLFIYFGLFIYLDDGNQRYLAPEPEESNYIEPEPSHSRSSPPADHSHTPTPGPTPVSTRSRNHGLDRNEIISTEQMCKSIYPHSRTQLSHGHNNCNNYYCVVFYCKQIIKLLQDGMNIFTVRI